MIAFITTLTLLGATLLFLSSALSLQEAYEQRKTGATKYSWVLIFVTVLFLLLGLAANIELVKLLILILTEAGV